MVDVKLRRMDDGNLRFRGTWVVSISGLPASTLRLKPPALPKNKNRSSNKVPQVLNIEGQQRGRGTGSTVTGVTFGDDDRAAYHQISASGTGVSFGSCCRNEAS